MSQSQTMPSVTIQSCVFTAKRWGQFPTITYKNGGTAGSEVVTIDNSANVTVQIESGVSTNTQIVAAVNAATQANGRGPGDFVLASTSSGATTPTCTTLVPIAGGVTTAVKASLTVGSVKFLAGTAGTGGNSNTLKLIGNTALVIGTVTDGTHLVITSNALMIVGATITQGANTCTITTVTDATHLVVSDTTGFTAAAATSSVVAGSEKCKVTSTAVLVQIQDGVSTWENLRAIIAATGSAAALMVESSLGPSLIRPITIANTVLGSATSLAGGLAAGPATVTVNGITVTSITNDATQNGLTFTLTPGATAGAEVVTVDASGNVSVQVEANVSTRTQIKTALDAAAAFTALFTDSVTSGSTANQAVYQNAMTGSASDPGYAWYRDNGVTALTSTFVYFAFNNMAQDFHLQNDEASGAKTVIGSWDGVNNHFIVSATEKWDAQHVNRPGVFLKYGSAAPAYKAWTINR